MPELDLNAIAGALFVPILLWTGSVIAVSLYGYPGVICLTPIFWLLAALVGLRVRRETHSSGNRPVLEGAIAGGMLGLWQGGLAGGVMAFSPNLPAKIISLAPAPLLAATLIIIISVPITSGLAAWVVWRRK